MTEDCFLICPIGAENSKERLNTDKLQKHILEPVLLEAGFEIVRADKMSESGLISTQILSKIVECPLVVADLTGHNPNVFYELALRHAVRKPYIQMIFEEDRIPFDVSGVRTIHYNLSDLDKVEKTKIEISSQISTIKAGHRPDSPISIAVTSEVSGISTNALEVFLEKFWSIEEDLSSLKSSITEIANREALELSASDVESAIESALDFKMSDLAEGVASAVVEKLPDE